MSIPATPSTATPFLSSPHTLAHLLALPPLLLPLSPNLSALHLARLRLLAALPSETTHLVCCSKCGALNVPGWTSAVEVGRGKVKTATKGGGLAKGGGRRKKAFNRIKTTCLVCGEIDCRPGSDMKTLQSFPSTRRTRKQTLADEEEPVKSTPLAAVASLALSPSNSTSTPMDVDQGSPLPTSAAPSPVSSSSKPPASALSSPRLKHVPLSHPTVPSNAQPPSPSSSEVSKEVDKKAMGRKKTKKSGLQKMLALNKEKEEAKKSKTGGGLMDWMN